MLVILFYSVTSHSDLPSILTEPINLTVISPANANFTCVAMGIPYPDISWWLFGPSSPDNFSSVSNTSTHDSLLDAVTRQSILTLPSADFEHKSPVLIACVANNSVGVVIASAILIIKGEVHVCNLAVSSH